MHLRGWRLTSGTPPGTGCSLLAVETPRNRLGRTHDGPTVMPWRRRAGTLVAAAAGRECSRVTCGEVPQVVARRDGRILTCIAIGPLAASCSEAIYSLRRVAAGLSHGCGSHVRWPPPKFDNEEHTSSLDWRAPYPIANFLRYCKPICFLTCT